MAISQRHALRPKGIWKVHSRDGRLAKRSLRDVSPPSPPMNEPPFKKRRIQESEEDEVYFCSLLLPTTPMEPVQEVPQKNMDEPCTIEDWYNLKAQFALVEELYEGPSPMDSLPALRKIIRECHRFLKHHPDPSIIFNPEPGSSVASISTDLPTAFHSIFATALFFFGTLIAEDSSITQDGEPKCAVTYWLAALDMFETGDNLPSCTSGSALGSSQDWRLSLMWGKTLICLVDEMLTRAGKDSSTPSTDFMVTTSNIKWPRNSVFDVIANRRLATSFRLLAPSSTANDLVILATDLLLRGIFHLPHPQHRPLHPLPAVHDAKPSAPSSSSPITSFHLACSESTEMPRSKVSIIPILTATPPSRTFSRASHLFSIASSVLLITEKLPESASREQWALWADSVFAQMKLEGDTENQRWREPILRGRGRCWVLVGASRAESIEDQLEAGEGPEVLMTEEADDAREALENAIGYLDRVKELDARQLEPSGDDESSNQEHDIQNLLAEALLTLANLTVEESKREELYRRAQKEGVSDFGLGLDTHPMDEGQRPLYV